MPRVFACLAYKDKFAQWPTIYILTHYESELIIIINIFLSYSRINFKNGGEGQEGIGLLALKGMFHARSPTIYILSRCKDKMHRINLYIGFINQK